jgi:hypothetical protein
MNHSIKKISDNSYILSKHGKRIAILTDSDAISAIGSITQKKFPSWEDLYTFLGETPKVEETESEDNSVVEASDIKGFPVKHKTVFDITEDPFITYAKNPGSKTRFVAGYICLKFAAAGWVAALNPKLNTLSEVEYLGPFKTKFEAVHAMGQEKNKPVV